MRIRDRLRSVLPLLALAALGCYPSVAPPDPTRGLWSGSAGDRRFVFEFQGSQFLYVVPDLDAVAVLTGGNQFNRTTFLPPHILAPRLLPAFER